MTDSVVNVALLLNASCCVVECVCVSIDRHFIMLTFLLFRLLV